MVGGWPPSVLQRRRGCDVPCKSSRHGAVASTSPVYLPHCPTALVDSRRVRGDARGRSPQPELFEGIPWSTDAVFSMTLGKASGRGLSVHVLPRWFDVDTETDLRRLHAEMTATNHGALRTYASATVRSGGRRVPGRDWLKLILPPVSNRRIW